MRDFKYVLGIIGLLMMLVFIVLPLDGLEWLYRCVKGETEQDKMLRKKAEWRGYWP